MIWAANSAGEVAYICHEWCVITGQALAEARGSGWLQAVHPDERDTMREAFLGAFAQQCTFLLRYRLRRHDGAYTWVTGSAAPSFHPGTAEFIGFLGTVCEVEGIVAGLVAAAELRRFHVITARGEFAPTTKLEVIAHNLMLARSSTVGVSDALLADVDAALFRVGRLLAAEIERGDGAGNIH